MTSRSRAVRLLLLILAASALPLPGLAASPDVIATDPWAPLPAVVKTVALYGNSFTHYNNNLNTRLRDLTRSLMPDHGKGFSFRGITISSGHLGWHLPNLIFQNGLQHWDAVVFQGNSTEPISKDAQTRAKFVQAATKMSDIAHAAGSRVVYFMTWAARKPPAQTDKLARAYLDIAQKTGGTVAPVGLAFAKARDSHPDISLYFVDGKHPSLNGTYLAACVFFATLYDRSPVGGAPATGSTMTVQTAQALQQVAWDTVRAFRHEAPTTP